MKIFILAGGGGTRLFPLSRERYPKQFCKFLDEESFFQKTLKRALKIVETLDDIIFLTHKNYFFLLNNQVYEVCGETPKHVILEPTRKNTAPAIALGIKYILEKKVSHLEEPLFVFPADHLIEPEEEFANYIKESQDLTQKNYLITFGIIPSRPETGYGYIEADVESFYQLKTIKAFKVIKFHEKPSFETAQYYLEKGNYYWNSGIFGFTAETLLQEFKTYTPQIFELLQLGLNEVLENFFKMPEISIDYAVMEKTNRACVIPLFVSWSDVGSFEAFYEVLKKDFAQNVIKGRVIVENTKNSLILGNKRLIATLGVEDLIIVETEDVVLIAKKGSGQKIKNLVSELKKNSETQILTEVHTTEYRPWGSFTVLEEGERYKIKKIVVKPGETLSLQMHYHRSEHWVVIRGTALVIIEEDDGILREIYVKENESFFVPKTKKHRLVNPGKIPLEIIEVQVGEYVKEDDIVRFEDKYFRE